MVRESFLVTSSITQRHGTFELRELSGLDDFNEALKIQEFTTTMKMQIISIF